MVPRDKLVKDLEKYTDLTFEKQRDLALKKFGKRVIFGGKKTTKEMLSDHLDVIHNHYEDKRNSRQQKLDEEKAYLEQVRLQIEKEESRKKKGIEFINKEFKKANDAKLDYNEQVKFFDKQKLR